VLSDGQIVRARCVVIASGADYRRLTIDDAERFEGVGLYYAATHVEALQCSGEEVVVVGGGNSAGQAVMNLARYAEKVHLVARRPLAVTMSRYLADRIEAAASVQIWAGSEVTAIHGSDRLEAVTIGGFGQSDHRVSTTAVFAMIGASPRTEGFAGLVGVDDKGFIVTGDGALHHPDFHEHWDDAGRRPLLLETTRRDVFAVGDVRHGSTKRVASAIGDGALVVRSIHESLDTAGVA
jgi:thioredoxin reductase (NADPH)